MPLHLAHIPIPLSSAGSSIVTVIRQLTSQHAGRGGRTTVVSAVDRDLRVPLAHNLLIDFSESCARGWFSRAETLQDFAIGALGLTRPHWGRIQGPAIRALAPEKPDIVLIHEGHYALSSVPDWRRSAPRLPRVLYVHNPVSRSYGRLELRRLLGQLDGIVFVSEDARRTLRERAGGRLPPSAVVHNGVDFDTFHPAERSPAAPDRLRITFAGQVSDYKGPHLMLRAIAAAGLRSADIRVVGSSAHRAGLPLSDYEDALRALAEELRLSVRFIPFCPQRELAGHLRDSDVVCVPSVWQEPFGMAVLEAMACGAAVVASDRGGLREACGGAALLVDPEDQDQFAAALYRLTDPAILALWQRRALERARAMTWGETYVTLMTALDRFLRQRGPS